MEHLPAKKCTEPDEYGKCQVWISLTSEDGKYHIGNMQRCGITPPGYPDRATYAAYPWKSEITGNDVYVYDGGYFWVSCEWRAYFREHGISPAGAQANDACTRPVVRTAKKAKSAPKQKPVKSVGQHPATGG